MRKRCHTNTKITYNHKYQNQGGVKEQKHKGLRGKTAMLPKQIKMLNFKLKMRTATRYLFSLIKTALTYTCMFNSSQSVLGWALSLSLCWRYLITV